MSSFEDIRPQRVNPSFTDGSYMTHDHLEINN
jgi:hypothetical protein